MERIAIIGGGIGGLTLGLALQQRGIEMVIYEQANVMREVGAGIILQPNGRKGLVSLSIDEPVAAVSSRMSKLHGCDYRSGEVQSSTSNDAIAKRYGLPSLAVHRGDLHGVLLRAVLEAAPDSIKPGYEFVGMTQKSDGVELRFSNKPSERAALVVGADGNGSTVRSTAFPGTPVRFNGQVAFRAIIPMERVPPIVAELELAMYRGSKRYVLHYPLRGGELMNLIGCGQTDIWENEGWAIPAEKEQFLDAYSDFAPHLLELIDAIPSDDFFKWGLYDRPPLECWTNGRVTMMGDAAHPMTPFLGQGAAMAIEDAVVLARAIDEAPDVETALIWYEETRRERGNNVALWSWEEGRALQNPSIASKGAAGYGLLDYDPATTPLVRT